VLVAGLPAIAPARIFPGILSSLVRSYHGVTSPKLIPLAAGQSIFKVLCLLTKLILPKKQAPLPYVQNDGKWLESSIFPRLWNHGIMVINGRIFLMRGGV
jgi:hypothetical protein